MVKNDLGSLGVFVGEAAVDLDVVVHTGKENRIEAFHDNVDVSKVGAAMEE